MHTVFQTLTPAPPSPSCFCAVCGARNCLSLSFLGWIAMCSSRLIEFFDAFVTCLLRVDLLSRCSCVYQDTLVWPRFSRWGVCVCVCVWACPCTHPHMSAVSLTARTVRKSGLPPPYLPPSRQVVMEIKHLVHLQHLIIMSLNFASSASLLLACVWVTGVLVVVLDLGSLNYIQVIVF